jgi:twitching motility protein PilU
MDLARLIEEGVISRDEGLSHADSPTNLLWRLQNDQGPVSRVAPKKEEPEAATFTEITIDVVPEDTRSASLNAATWPPRS